MVDYSRYEHLKVEKQDGIALVTLNRPEALNAVNQKMHLELSTIFEDLGKDEEVKVVVLTGAGRAFSSGGDIKWMQEREHNPAYIKKAMREARKIIEDILNLEAPIIAAVNGAAVGLGATIALFCDMIIASEKARFSDPHVRVGVVAGDGGAVIWPLLVGVAKAKELLLTGDMIDAQEAERIGLVNKVVPAAELMPTAMSLARRLADGPALAIQWTKMAINKRIKQDVNLILDNSLAWEEHTFYSDDHREAAAAFVEKREPRFQGR
jgi:enoyl-CoA hydratase